MILSHRITPRVRRISTHARPTLPRLPVPPLRQTLDQYLKSIEPFLIEDEAHGGAPFAKSYQRRVEWAKSFEMGVGKTCQERLLALDQTAPDNWLSDIWLKKIYLEWRAPLVINSNWWLTFQNDSGVPEDVLNRYTNDGGDHITPWQVRRAAWLVHQILDFKDRLNSEELHPDTTRTGIWIRDTTAKMFNICRIPLPGTDMLSQAPSPSSPNARKLFVMLYDWGYAVDVYDRNLIRASWQEIERRLSQVVTDAEKRRRRGEEAVPIGVLSADDRDSWAKNFRHLSLSPQNRETFRIIQESIFALCLDHWTRGPDVSTLFPPSNMCLDLDAHLHNIRSSINARNRWFDKAFTLVVESNTRAGAMGEHSPCDGLVPSIVCEYAIVEGADWETEPLPCFDTLEARTSGWKRLDWVTDNFTKLECIDAEQRASVIIKDSDDSEFWFQEYGADWIKNISKFSPDAYLQMCLQLAWYRMRGYFTATYETALTRSFAKGRTETIRTFTTDSRAWVLGMNDPSTSMSSRHALLSRAVQTHTSLTRRATTGRGIDRHLLGLRYMLANGEQCQLFDDELFQRSQRWLLSTSGLSAGHLFRGTGFGATYHDGYGINYLAGPDVIKFGIECKHSCPETSTQHFTQAIAQALRDMKAVCEVESREQINKL